MQCTTPNVTVTDTTSGKLTALATTLQTNLPELLVVQAYDLLMPGVADSVAQVGRSLMASGKISGHGATCGATIAADVQNAETSLKSTKDAAASVISTVM
jgi:hypothetical protein